MTPTSNKFTIKIILSYLVLGALAVAVSYFLYTEYQTYNQATSEVNETDKIIETGALINLMYEADSYGRLAVLTTRKEDFNQYVGMVDSLHDNIDEVKEYITDSVQLHQLDSVKILLNEKKNNIEQLRVLEITSNRDTSIEDILEELKFMDNDIGIISAGNLFKNSSRLDERSYNAVQAFAEYLNRNSGLDTTQVPASKVDSLLAQSRYIVREAQKENSRMRNALRRKENELIQNDLVISSQLEEIMTNFDAEIVTMRSVEQQQREASEARTKEILQIAGIAGAFIVFLFSYLILTDFFKAERLKRGLKEEKAYSDSLLKSREQLISAVSHDLKTPLQTISGYSELLKNDLPPEKQKHYLQRINSSSGYVTNLVDDLLDFSRLEAGKLVLEKVPFSLEQLLRESGESNKDRYLDKPVELRFEIDETVSGVIYKSDPLRIRQIVNNLVGNAFKFTEEGSVSLFAEQIKNKKGKTKIRITVRDTGIGISEEKQEEIFREFTQADGSIAGKFGGTGLGLAISRRLTDLLEGTLQVESTLGKGSTFILTLPLEKSTEETLLSHSVTYELIKPLKAVVVDDDPSIIAMLKDLFDSQGLECHTFQGASAMENGTPNTIDFVLTDIQMPGIDGFELLEKLKRGDCEWYEDQPVVAMTGNREIPEQTYSKKGFSSVLQKPFKRDTLFESLHELFPEHFSEKEIESLDDSSYKKSDLYDLSLLRSFLETDDALAYTLDIFFSETETNLDALRTAFQIDDYEAIRSTAHKMLTMSRQLEAKRVTPILERLENVTPDNTLEEELKGLKDGLTQEITALVEALQKTLV